MICREVFGFPFLGEDCPRVSGVGAKDLRLGYHNDVGCAPGIVVHSILIITSSTLLALALIRYFDEILFAFFRLHERVHLHKAFLQA